MSLEKIPYLSSAVADNLLAKIEQNIDRYQNSSFDDLVEGGGWSIRLSISGDLELLADLNPAVAPEVEVENSLIVWRALRELSPSIACENRFWTRLCHVECLQFARDRWIRGLSSEKLVASIRKHFFALTPTGWRDDNAVSRLWWNAYVAHSLHAHDMESALKLILKTADIRSNFIERPWITTRKPLASGLLRSMNLNPWTTSREEHFREIMKTINRRGGEHVFEVMSEEAIDQFISECIDSAQSAFAPRDTETALARRTRA